MGDHDDPGKAENSSIGPKRKEGLHFVTRGLAGFAYLQGTDHAVHCENHGFREIFGNPEEKYCYQILKEESKPCVSCPVAVALKTGIPQETDYTAKDGRIYRIFDAVIDLPGGGKMVIRQGIEITKYEKKMEELRKYENHFKLSMGEHSYWAWEWDMENDEVSFDGRFPEILDGKAAEDTKKPISGFLSLILPEDRARLRRGIKRHVKGGTSIDIDFRLDSKTGASGWFNLCAQTEKSGGASTGRMTGFIRDISARRETEEAAKGINAFMERIMDSTTNAIFVLAHDLTILHANRRGEEMTGFYLTELINMPSPRIFADESSEKLREKMAIVLSEGKSISIPEARIMKKDGGQTPVRLEGTPLVQEGRIVSAILTLEDISRMKRMEKLLLTGIGLSRTLAESKGEREMLADTCRVLVEKGGYAMALACLYTADIPSTLKPVASSGIDISGAEALDLSWAKAMKPDGGPSPSETASPYHAHIEFPKGLSEYPHMAYIPLALDGKRIGALLVYASAENEPGGQEIEVLETAGKQISRHIQIMRARTPGQETKTGLPQSHTMLNAINTALSMYIDYRKPHMVFDSLLNTLLSATESEFGLIAEYIDDDGEPCLRTLSLSNLAWDDETRKLYAEAQFSGMRFTNLKTLIGLAAVTGKPVISNNPAGDPRSGGTPHGHPPIKTFMGIPLYKAGKLTGIIDIANRPGGYNETFAEYLAPLLGTCATLIESLRMEREKKKAEADRERVFTLSLDLLCIAGMDGYFRRVNPAFTKVFGYTEKELLETPFIDLIHPDDREAATREMELLKEKRVTNFFENRYVCKDGSFKWITWNACSIPEEGVIYAIGRDSTERKKLDEELRESEERFRKLFENSPDAIFVADAATGVILDANPAASLLLRRPRTELVGMHQSELHPPEKKTYSIDTFREHGETGANEAARLVENHVIRSDGEVLPVEVAGHPVQIGGKTAVIGVFRDITERKRAEETLRKAKEEAEYATKLKDKFVSLVSHDLKGPLGAVQGYLRLASDADGNFSAQEITRFISTASEGIISMLSLIDNLLNISRIKSGQIKPPPVFFNTWYAVETAIQGLEDMMEKKGISIANEVPRDSRMYADPTLFTEVLKNLAHNSIKFSMKGHGIRIFSPEGNPSAVAVLDNGVGIKPEQAVNIFSYEEKTSTIGTAGEIGTGLGLPLCRDIMAAYGGDLTMKSEPGEGTVFYASLPYVVPTILVVEDDPRSSILIENVLREIRAEFITTSTAEEAVREMEKKRPHLVIAEIGLPGMDGMQLLKLIKGNPETSAIPVIIATSSNEKGLRERAFQAGANDYVNKPLIKEDLIPRVRRFVW